MKRVITLTALLLAVSFVLGGCSEDETKSQVNVQVTNQTDNQNNDQVKDDLAKYLLKVRSSIK